MVGGSCCYYDKYTVERNGIAAAEWWELPNTNVPAALKGVMWLPGNADPSLLSFNTSHYEPGRRRLKFKIFAPDAWASTTVLSQSTAACSSYVLYLREDLKHADIHVTSDWPCCCRVESCTWIVDYTMTQQGADANAWRRHSVVCKHLFGGCLSHEYTLTRIVDDAGRKTAHYEKMVAAAPSDHWTLHTRTSCPCYCGADASHHARRAAPPASAGTATKVAPGEEMER